MARAENSTTPIIASTLIIAVLFIGAIYFWSQQVRVIEQRQRASSTAALQNTESDLVELEAELSAVDFSEVDAATATPQTN